jgi:stage IV sporulation protein FB
MIIRIPLFLSKGRVKFLFGLALFLFAASQINADYFLPVLVAWLWHEAGHLVAGHFMNLRLQPQSGWLGVGIKSEADMRPAQAAILALAGPAADWLWFGIASIFGWQNYALAAAVLAVINLLPILPMDGGRALVAWCSRFGSSLRLGSVLSYGGQVFALVLVMVIIGFNMRLWLLILPLVIFILAAGEEKKAVYAEASAWVKKWREEKAAK